MPSIPDFVSVPLALALGIVLTFEVLAVWDGYVRRRELERWLRGRGLAVAAVPRQPLAR
jgi:hypothetical protein